MDLLPNVWRFGAEGFKVRSTGVETALYAILYLCAKLDFDFIVTPASQETLEYASNSSRIMETVHS